MSRFSLGLEAQEQDLEYDSIMADDSDDDSDNIAESPFSPMASRAFSTAVDDTDTLERMNDVLEGSDIDDIPEASRRVIQTAMESVRSRLLGGYSVRGVAVEGFANNKDLKIAIEETKTFSKELGMLLLNSSRVSMIGLLVSSRRRKLMQKSFKNAWKKVT